MAGFALPVAVVFLAQTALAAPGAWPEPRQNAHLTALQPLPGKMREAPRVLARYNLGCTAPGVQRASQPDGAETGLAIVGGALFAFTPDNALKWTSHPRGLNFTAIVACEDLDGDGLAEVLLQAGRPEPPYGAAVLVDLESGAVRWRYDVEPMSYAWYLHAGAYWPDMPAKQILVLMHGYPPDEKNGYAALFAFDKPGEPPRQHWRYDFHQYTCFPSLLRTDFDGDGTRELVVETHSRMWFLDPVSGAMEHFETWDVAPANVRSYGIVEFIDLDRDGREDFLCIADFAQHHEVLLNRGGHFERAWLHAWGESVTTGKVDTAYPQPAYGDVDGDNALEVVVSVFNGEGENAWKLRVYDAVTGTIEHGGAGLVPVTIVDVNGDGAADIAANRVDTASVEATSGACVLSGKNGDWLEIWSDPGTRIVPSPQPGRVLLNRDGVMKVLRGDGNGVMETDHAPTASSPRPGFEHIPAMASAEAAPTLLLADLGRGGTELLAHGGGRTRVLRWQQEALVLTGEYPSLSIPVVADFDGDGAPDLARTELGAARLPVVEAVTPARNNRVLWRTELPAPAGTGLPNGQAAYARAGRLTGAAMPDLYVWFGAPAARSFCLDGRTGRLVWEQGERPEIERFWGPSVNLASVYDFNGDGAEDLVFTNPDYFCVADGQTGAPLLGPLFPPKIFSQPSQGLYTLPAILERVHAEPLVCLVDGHYFQGVMTLHADPKWHRILKPGENRAGAEGFLQVTDGAWLMGFGRQNGTFACVNAETGAPRWELSVEASSSDVLTCDVDGDARHEFVFATSHGELWAAGDDGSTPRIVWRAPLGAPASGAPIAGDINGDGYSEVAVTLANGELVVLGAKS